MNNSGNDALLWPLLFYSLLVFLVAAGMLTMSHLLGQRHVDKETNEPFESGIKITGSARLRFSPQFYLIAMFFVVFDLEAVFIIAWAVSVKEAGWAGYFGILVFIIILAAVLIYEWRTGALDIGVSGKKVIKAMKRMRENSENEMVVKQR